ncbi:MAG TPA: rod shape-determining protein, partial [Eubacteriaceae bacterium]|nr:rod shape-determining protein [Eubacteriaceae bacterium]
GAGIDITQPTGNMVVDIGGGTTDIAVLSLGGIVESTSIKIAGDRFDESIVRYMRKNHNVLIGERTAEDLKIKIGSAYPSEEEPTMDIRGRDLLSGLPKTITVTSEEIRMALSDNISAVINAIHSVLEKTPPELAADISDTGIYLAGGGAILKGLDVLIEERMGVPVNIVENAESSVAFGTGKILDNIAVLGSGVGKRNYD